MENNDCDKFAYRAHEVKRGLIAGLIGCHFREFPLHSLKLVSNSNVMELHICKDDTKTVSDPVEVGVATRSLRVSPYFVGVIIHSHWLDRTTDCSLAHLTKMDGAGDVHTPQNVGFDS